MTNLADNVIALQTAVSNLQAAITPTTPVDLTATNTAIAAVQATVNDIDSKVTPSA